MVGAPATIWTNVLNPSTNPALTNNDGVMPSAVPASTSLLRTDDRGVCQRCHEK